MYDCIAHGLLGTWNMRDCIIVWFTRAFPNSISIFQFSIITQ